EEYVARSCVLRRAGRDLGGSGDGKDLVAGLAALSVQCCGLSRQRCARWQHLERFDGYLEAVGAGIFYWSCHRTPARAPDCIFEIRRRHGWRARAWPTNIAERLLGPSGVALVWTD